MERCFIALGMLGLVATMTLASPTPTQRCAATKVKAAGRNVFVTAKCYAKASVAGGEVSPDCLAKAAKRFQAAFAKADAKGGCTVVADAGSIGAAAAACVTSFTSAVAGESRCAAAKTKAVGKDAFAEATCRQKAFLAGTESVDPLCTAKAQAKLGAAVAMADGYGSCSGDVSALTALVGDCVAAVTPTFGPCAFQSDGGGMCGGTCAAGLVCLWDRMNGTCACVSSTSDCSQLAPPGCPNPTRLCPRPVDDCGPMSGGHCGCFGPTTSSTSSSTTSTSSTTTTSTSSTTTTTAPNASCSLQPDGLGGTCGGACPGALVCLWDRMNGTCTCASAISDCTQLSPPNCPDPSRLCARPADDCGPIGGGQCGCSGGPTTSSTSSSTSSSTTTTSTSSTSTTTIPAGPCALQPDGQGGTCGGACGAGLVCLWDRMNGTCACVSPAADCTQLAPPNCPDADRLCARPADDCGPMGGGHCGCFGPTTSSTSSSTSTSSTTTTSTSSTTTTTAPSACTLQPDGQGGTCGGPCVEGLVCLWNPMNGTCACESAVADCSQLAPPNCPDPSRHCARPSETCGPVGGGHCGCQ